MTGSVVRPFRAGDERHLSRICVQTADPGADATGLLDDDETWPALGFASPACLSGVQIVRRRWSCVGAEAAVT